MQTNVDMFEADSRVLLKKFPGQMASQGNWNTLYASELSPKLHALYAAYLEGGSTYILSQSPKMLCTVLHIHPSMAWHYMRAVLEAFGFSPVFCKYMKFLYLAPTAQF